MLILPSSALLHFDTKAAFAHIWLGVCPTFYKICSCPRPVKVLHFFFVVLSSQTRSVGSLSREKSKNPKTHFKIFTHSKDSEVNYFQGLTTPLASFPIAFYSFILHISSVLLFCLTSEKVSATEVFSTQPPHHISKPYQA